MRRQVNTRGESPLQADTLTGKQRAFFMRISSPSPFIFVAFSGYVTGILCVPFAILSGPMEVHVDGTRVCLLHCKMQKATEIVNSGFHLH